MRFAEYDILVTNPPYSGEHKTKLMDFLLSTINRRPKSSINSSNDPKRVPFALLLPTYTVTKSYWKNYVDESAKVTSNTFNLSILYCFHFNYVL